MTNWMLRGLVFAVATTVLRLFQGVLINAWPTHAIWVSVALLVPLVVGAAVWGMRDGRADARANPVPENRADLAMSWLLAGLVAGVLGGAVTWLIALAYKGLYVGGLINELTTFASFTALLVFVAAMAGVAAGRREVDRQREKMPVGHLGPAAGESRTDVFAAARADETPTGEVAVAEPGERPAAVATAERAETAQQVPPAYLEEPTQVTPAEAGEEPTTPATPPEEDQR
ncbi:B-4DMT family transporter [Mycobacterium sp. SM1]|uniref:B-4DMT family transporter n=1 Tax=Mycobacterium sp. SM1 TaxID=2816243 RepID=UPI001BCA8470|nr:B-4DMT family transporter [Mycobacterium sp. SM1]MBS4729408.1 B-4DMT family transporter [Mycobacterium sp. SM1]